MISRSVSSDQLSARLSLTALLAGIAATGALLWKLTAFSPLPTRLPTAADVVFALQSPGVAPDLIVRGFELTAWVFWLWMAGSTLLHLAVVIAEHRSSVVYVAALRRLSERLSAPIARRVVEGAVVAAFAVQLAGRAAPTLAAQPPTAPITAPLVMQQTASTAPQVDALADGLIRYTVQPGDSLWAIAQRFYGTGLEYPRVVTANKSRTMTDGAPFTNAGVIRPGWVLDVPLPSTAVVEVDAHVFYTVESGDTLDGIAARFLGDENRWPEIFQLNQGKARLADGHTLTAPDLIWPSLRIELPLPVEAKPAPPVVTTPAPAPAVVVPSVPALEPTFPVALPTQESKPTAEPARASSPHAGGIGWQEAAGTVAAAGALAAGAGLLRRRRLRLRSQLGTRAQDVPVDEGFAETQPARVLAHQLDSGDPEPVALVGSEVYRFLAEHAVTKTELLWIKDGRKATTVCLRAALPVAGQLLELGREFGRLLGGRADVRETPERDVEWRLSGVRWLGMARPAEGRHTPPLVPVALLGNQDILYANWPALGNLLVAGLPTGGGETIMSSITASLTARLRPEELRVWIIARPHTLPAELASLPHQLTGIVDPSDETALQAILDDVRTELNLRLRSDVEERADQRVLVIADVADLHGHETALDLIATKGPEHGIRVLAGMTPPPVDSSIVPLFQTRIVLRMETEVESIQLLGDVQAADLGAGGHLLVSIAGQKPVQGRGFRVAPEGLQELIAAMSRAYGVSSRAAAIEPKREPEPDSLESSEVLAEDETAPEPCDEAAPLSPSAAAPLAAPASERLAEAQVSLEFDPPTADSDETPSAELDGSHDERVIAVRCFGTLRVSSGGRLLSPVAAGSGEYKGWEILAFLATHEDSGVSKGKVLAALWPDLDEATAMNRLRVHMSRLRSTLASQLPWLAGGQADVIRCDRDGMCRIETTIVRSDVHEFIRLRDAIPHHPLDEAQSNYEKLNELYRGDLLDEPPYAWVHERDERGLTPSDRYRRDYTNVTAALAQRWRRDGKPNMAIPLYRNLLALDPTDEDVIAELYHCYAEAGDIDGLVKEEQRFRDSLRNLFADDDETARAAPPQPGPAIAAVYSQVRQHLEEQRRLQREPVRPPLRSIAGGR